MHTHAGERFRVRLEGDSTYNEKEREGERHAHASHDDLTDAQ